MELIKELVILTMGTSELLNVKCRRVATSVQKALGLETSLQAVLLSAFVNMFDDSHITARDLARHFDVLNIEMLSAIGELQYFIDREIIIRKTENDGSFSFRLCGNVISALEQGHLPEPRKRENLTSEEFLDYTMEIADRIREERRNSEIVENLRNIVYANTQIPLAAKIKSMDLNDASLIFFFALVNENVSSDFYSIGPMELQSYLRKGEMHALLDQLTEGEHVLVKESMVEPFCNHGHAAPGEWTFTKECYDAYLKDSPVSICVKNERDARKNLVHYEDIVAKELYYSDDVTRKVNELKEILQPDRMHQVIQQLGKRGMRKCFTCIFHGGPGTGKTESVQQLALLSGRDLMRVDIPTIRDKWVGETEKNIKRIFDRYRELAKDNDRAPILFFNEADALFCKRSSREGSAVEKMENAMQDIILQEMETLEGILICTTNLSNNLDAAFERRFLYKIEFTRPTALSRQKIWKAMLPEVGDDLAMRLADKYDFTGGEIENVTRKYAIDSILHCKEDIDESYLFDLCNSERYSSDKKTKVGFEL